MTRPLLFILLVCLGLVAPWWLYVPCCALYALRYRAYELVFAGILLDVTSGTDGFLAPFPYIYIVISLSLAYLGDVARPHLIFFNAREDVFL